MIWLMELLRDLSRIAASDKILRDKTFNITKISKYDEYQWDFLQLFLIVLIKKFSGGVVTQVKLS